MFAAAALAVASAAMNVPGEDPGFRYASVQDVAAAAKICLAAKGDAAAMQAQFVAAGWLENPPPTKAVINGQNMTVRLGLFSRPDSSAWVAAGVKPGMCVAVGSLASFATPETVAAMMRDDLGATHVGNDRGLHDIWAVGGRRLLVRSSKAPKDPELSLLIDDFSMEKK